MQPSSHLHTSHLPPSHPRLPACAAVVDPEAGVEALPVRTRDKPDPAAAKQQAAAKGEQQPKQQAAEAGKQKQAEAGAKKQAAPPGADTAGRNATESASKGKQEPPEQPGDRRLLRQRHT